MAAIGLVASEDAAPVVCGGPLEEEEEAVGLVEAGPEPVWLAERVAEETVELEPDGVALAEACMLERALLREAEADEAAEEAADEAEERADEMAEETAVDPPVKPNWPEKFSRFPCLISKA
jgi:hypothetical protein